MTIKKRIQKLERWLGSSLEPETLEEMFDALMRGDYGQVNLASVIASMLSCGGSVEQLRGREIPDMLLDALAEHLGDPVDGEDGREVDGL